MKRIDVNADVGEGFAAVDAALVPMLSSANIACGGHAGDAGTMAACVALCIAHGVAIGAHPSYPDREGFGRRDMKLAECEIRSAVSAQIEALAAIAAAAGAVLTHVKPHGALYNRAAVDPALATAIAVAVRDVDPSLALVGLAGSRLPEAGRRAGLRVLCEGFADRRYTRQGLLVSRSEADAVIVAPEDLRAQLISMVLHHRVQSRDGIPVPLDIDTVCLHGDGPHAVEFAHLVREVLADAGVQISAVSS